MCRNVEFNPIVAEPWWWEPKEKASLVPSVMLDTSHLDKRSVLAPNTGHASLGCTRSHIFIAAAALRPPQALLLAVQQKP